MIVTTKKLFEHAYGKYAIGAYNINNLEQLVGLFQGNLNSKAPFIIQISKGARSYTNKVFLEALIRAADEVYPEAIFAVHLDHGDEETCYDCINSGFYSSVMIDASHEPFEKNVEITRRVVEVGDGPPADEDAAAVGTIEAGDEVQERALPGSRGPGEQDELPGGERQRHVVERADPVAERLADALDHDGHARGSAQIPRSSHWSPDFVSSVRPVKPSFASVGVVA